MSETLRFGIRYGERVRVFSNPGSDVSTVYSARFDDEGRLVLDAVGERNVFDEIQSHREEADLQSILARYNAGDTSALSKVQGFFGDVTGVPTTYADFFNLMKRGHEFFDSLDPEVRQNFGNSFEQFMVASQSPDFMSKLQTKKEVVSSESEHAE